METQQPTPSSQDAHSQNFLVGQSKKEAKRLLRLALAQAGVIHISNLSEAQGLVARLKGKADWRELVLAAEQSKPIPVKSNAPAEVPGVTRSFDGLPLEGKVHRIMHTTLDAGDAHALNPEDMFRLIDKELAARKTMGSVDAQAFHLRGYAPKINLAAHIYAGLRGGHPVVADGLMEIIRQKPHFASMYDFSHTYFTARMTIADLVEDGIHTREAVRKYLHRSLGARIESFDEMNWTERAMIALLAGRLCQIDVTTLQALLYLDYPNQIGASSAQQAPYSELKACILQVLEACQQAPGFGRIADIRHQHSYVRTFILGLLDACTSEGMLNTDALFNIVHREDLVLWQTIADFSGDSHGLEPAGAIAQYLHEREHPGTNLVQIDVALDNLMYEISGYRGDPEFAVDRISMLPLHQGFAEPTGLRKLVGAIKPWFNR